MHYWVLVFLELLVYLFDQKLDWKWARLLVKFWAIVFVGLGMGLFVDLLFSDLFVHLMD